GTPPGGDWLPRRAGQRTVRPHVPVSLDGPILVLGGYGYRNVGDEAMLAGLLREIGTDRRVTVVSRLPAETAALHGVRSIPISQSVQALRGHRSLIIGGG